MTRIFLKPAIAGFLALTAIGPLTSVAGAADTTALKTTGIQFAYDSRKGVIQDAGKSDEWLVAAGKGDVVAQYNLGVMNDIGDDVPVDKAQAVKWYRQAAEQGHDYAQSNLGMKYDKGEGVAKDDAEAVKWYRMAADHGAAPAQTNLGVKYANGEGVERNNVQAYLWLGLGAAQGNVTASRNVDTLTKRMSAAELTEAKRLVAEWKPKAAAAKPAAGDAAGGQQAPH